MASVYNAAMLLVFALACVPPAPSVMEGSPHVEALVLGDVAGAATGSASVVLSVEGTETWTDAAGEMVASWATEAGPASQIAERDGARFVLANGRVRVLRSDGELVPLGLDDLVPAPIQAICADAIGLWMQTDPGLHLWRAGVVSEVRVGDAAPSGPMACGGQLFDESVTWVATGTLVHAIASNGATFAGFESFDLESTVQSIAVDRHGHAWATGGGVLHHRGDAGWQPVPLEAPVDDVLGGAQSNGVWASTQSGPNWLVGDARVIVTDAVLDVPPRTPWQTDVLGRLLVHTDDGVRRLAQDRPLWWDGPPDGASLAQPTPIRLVPTAPGEVVGLTVRLGDLPLEVDDGVVWLDPTPNPGEHVVTVQVDYPTQSTETARTYLLQSPGSITWAEHIEPIHADACAVCHENTADTVLQSATDWEFHIVDILANVESGAMPLGAPALPSSQVGLVRAWRDGGFP